MSYLGSKGQAGVFQRIIGNMPPHSVYVEPFFGSGKIFWTKFPAADSVIIDADTSKISEALDAINDVEGLDDISSTRAICGDALTILPKLALPADALIYCDPPYVHSTRTSRHRYRFEMTDEQHTQLLTLLQAMQCRVMISGYPSALYSKMLRGWRCISYRTRTRGRTLTECLWCNFPEPTELHDWRFAGLNHRERVTLKRQAARWTTRIEKMPPLKRGYLLHAIHQSQNRRGVPAVNTGTVTHV